MICFYGYWSQFNVVFYDVIYIVNVCNVSVLEFIDFDVVLFIGCNICCCQVDGIGGWVVIDCLNQGIYVVCLIIFQMQCQVIIGFFYYLFWYVMGVQLWFFVVYYFY